MKREMVLLALLLLAVPAQAEERTIQLHEVAVRSGPALVFAPTMTLHQGDKVNVLHVLNGFAAITPPPGSFSLIPCSAVMQTSTTVAFVKLPYAQTVIGSSITTLANRPGIQVQRNQQLHVLDSVYLVQPSGKPEPYFKIVPPPGEVRYVPEEAFQPFQTAKGPGSKEAEANGMTAFYPPDPQTALLLREADEAYQRGFQTGNWEEAQRKYAVLAESTNHHARMTALNRLEFIRRAMANPQPRGGQPWQPAAPMKGAPPQNPDWRLASSAPPPPATPTGNDRLPPTSTPPASPFPPTANGQGNPPPMEPNRPQMNTTPQQRPTMTTSTERPVTPSRQLGPQTNQGLENHLPKPIPAGGQAQVGILQQAFQSQGGRPLYYLTSSSGYLVCYLTSAQGDLRAYVGKPVEVTGSPLSQRIDLGGKHMTVHQIKVLANLPQQ
jgi:hypothetical protein